MCIYWVAGKKAKNIKNIREGVFEQAMTTVVKAKPEESADSVIRRFKKKVFFDDILTELKKREYHRKPSVDKKEKLAEIKRKRKYRKKQREMQ